MRTHFKGKTGQRLPVSLPDQIAPPRRTRPRWDNNTGVATLTEHDLADDSSLSDVNRTVNWDDGTSATYLAGEPITHTYPLTEWRYVPTVTLEDAVHNTSAAITAAAIVINDTEAPTGTFTNGSTTGWAKLTKVTVTQTALADNWSPAPNIARRIAWGDGTSTAWRAGTTISHVYAKAGTFTPAVTITDEAGIAATVSTSAVAVKVDKTGPRVTLARSRPKHSVKAWRKLRGQATDAGTGVKTVSLKAVEKRKGHWFAYNARTHRWVKAATKAKAFARSTALTRTTDPQHRWTAELRGLRKGTLVYKVWATDAVKNRSATVTHKASLSRR